MAMEISINRQGYLNLFDIILANPQNIQLALDDANAQDLVLIYPIGNDEDQLEKLWNDYNQMTKPFRRRSDWIAHQYFGMNNQTMYEIIKSTIVSKKSYDKVRLDGSVGQSGDPLVIAESYGDQLSYRSAPDTVDVAACLKDKDIDICNMMADGYAKDTDRIIFTYDPSIGLDGIDARWNAFNMMLHKHRRESDWKCEEIYGVTNQKLYDHLRSMKLKDPIEDVSPNVFESYSAIGKYFKRIVSEGETDSSELASGLANLLYTGDNYDGMMAGNVISDVLDYHDGLNADVLYVDEFPSDLPMYTPDEMIDLGVYNGAPECNMFGVLAEEMDDLSTEWFEEYCNLYKLGAMTESYRILNRKRMTRIANLETQMLMFSESDHPRLQQAIAALGWNPNVPFSEANRSKADRHLRSMMELNTGSNTFIDMRGFDDKHAKKSSDNTSTLRPIYIVLEGGKAFTSDVIRAVTKGAYSHAALAFDSSLEKMYSYSMEGSSNFDGSFVIEDIRKKPRDAGLKLYTVFVDEKAYDKIKKNVDWYIKNQKNTHYSWGGLLNVFFNIPIKKESSTVNICSQFVDRMLKLSDIDFMKKPSSIVTPNDIDRAAKKNKRIYTIYSGTMEKYRKTVADKKVMNLIVRAKLFNENMSSFTMSESAFITGTKFCMGDTSALMAMYESIDKFDNKSIKRIYESLIVPCFEAREFPVDIKNNGDIIVNKLTPLNFESEYNKSHELLLEYDRANNIEGMKNELAHLWYINIVLEKRLHSSLTTANQKTTMRKTRARVLNDFKKYMKVVLRHDKSFNFTKYFEDSKYSDAAYRISGGTAAAVFSALKQLM